MDIDLFEMERMQSLYWHLVDYDLSESGVTPMTIRELLGPAADAEAFLQTALGYPLSEGRTKRARTSPPGTRTPPPRTSRSRTGAPRRTTSRSGRCWSPMTGWRS